MEKTRIDPDRMLFLLKTYENKEGIILCCEKHRQLTPSLLTYYIRQKEDLLE